MKQLILLTMLLAAGSATADTWVDGYTRSDGTYVAGHYRSDANSTRYDNYSTRGNTNPYTGQPGYKSPDRDYRDSGYSNPYNGRRHYGN